MRQAGSREGVAKAFDEIASEFQHTRRTPWPSLKELGDCGGELVLDLGCGTGRNTLHLAGMGCSVVAADISKEMLKVLRGNIAKKGTKKDGSIDIVRCDALHLPFKSGCFKKVALIATIHHLPTANQRLSALVEVRRVTAPGGKVLVTAWSLLQRRFIPELPGMAVRKMKGGEAGDVVVRWGKKAERFYHLFTPWELRGLVKASGMAVLKIFGEKISSKVLAENWVAVAENPEECYS
jgi:ubiquinone/menaquinone biosynthesis C-methylase UbiE